MATSLTEHQVAELEATHAVGFTSQELVSAFQARGVRFSEANLRRYVQLGLVPRSRRVGRKGKNLGSRGLYPVRSVRRINAIKRLMEQRYTLEQIQEQFLAFKSAMDNLEDAVEEVLGLFEQKLDGVASERRAALARAWGGPGPRRSAPRGRPTLREDLHLLRRHSPASRGRSSRSRGAALTHTH